jgi:hypothetical protein
MNRRAFCLAGTGAALLAGRPLSAQSLAADDMEFADHMSRIGRAWRGLRQAMNASDQSGQALRMLQLLQAEMVAAKGKVQSVPMSPQAVERFKNDRQKYQKAFRLQLVLAVAESLNLEKALLEGNMEAAQATMRKLGSLQKDGHGLFQAKD